MELYLRDDEGLVITIPLEWLDEGLKSEIEELVRCTCHSGKVCAYCMGMTS